MKYYHESASRPLLAVTTAGLLLSGMALGGCSDERAPSRHEHPNVTAAPSTERPALSREQTNSIYEATLRAIGISVVCLIRQGETSSSVTDRGIESSGRGIYAAALRAETDDRFVRFQAGIDGDRAHNDVSADMRFPEDNVFDPTEMQLDTLDTAVSGSINPLFGHTLYRTEGSEPYGTIWVEGARRTPGSTDVSIIRMHYKDKNAPAEPINARTWQSNVQLSLTAITNEAQAPQCTPKFPDTPLPVAG